MIFNREANDFGVPKYNKTHRWLHFDRGFSVAMFQDSGRYFNIFVARKQRRDIYIEVS
jgi:hypothetical protein